MLGSAVRLPYHQPEKKDLSVFLARTELKQQKFVGTSRLSWNQFVPPTSSLSKVDIGLSTGAVSSEKVSNALLPESSVANDLEVAAVRCIAESDELPDLSSFCSKSDTVPNDILTSEATVSQEQPSSKSTQKKLLLLSPKKSKSAIAESSTSLNSGVPKHSETATEHVETSLAPAVVKKLLLDPVDKHVSNPLTSDVIETAASDAGECIEEGMKQSSMLECVTVDQSDGDEVIDEAPQQSTASKISSRISHRLLPSNVPLPQLSGNPNDLIELDDEDDGDGDDGNYQQGVEELMERLMQHSRGPAALARKPKTVEIR